MPRFEENGFLEALVKFRITQTVVVPPILMALSKCQDTSKLESLRRVFVGGSCATDGMQQQLYAKLSPNARIAQVYGMTEAGWATMWQSKLKDMSGSVGQPLPGSEMR
jgi:acyl-coenzyme A synthetase/AMP-(fatty) acid ligase